eukprot:Clim_evm32s155 gene=Clim_evmTU32s155
MHFAALNLSEPDSVLEQRALYSDEVNVTNAGAAGSGDARLKIGVLALQGDFMEHRNLLKQVSDDIEVVEMRSKADLESTEIQGMIIPGGESTTMALIAEIEGLLEPLRDFCRRKPVWGTCAGMIFLSTEVTHGKKGGQTTLGVLDATVDRNHFGRQIHSFEADVDIPLFHDVESNTANSTLVFIRAPSASAIGPGVKVLAEVTDVHQNCPSERCMVALQQGHILATSFHPELTNDMRWHQYFVRMVEHAERERVTGGQ